MRGGGGDGGAAAARAEEQARQERIRQGTTKINDTFNSQFTDDYFGTRRKSYLDYATPQLQKQFEDAQKELAFSLDRSGLTSSSVRAQKEAELAELFDTNKRAVADQALTYENTARTGVEDARANLISTLNATGDVEGASRSAIARAQALSQPDAYSPLGQLFATFTSGLGTQIAQERAAALSGGQYTPAINTGLFGPKKKSVVTSE